MQTETIDDVTWVSDERGNRCSDAYFGSIEDATTALESLRDCDDCINCSRCSDCSDCSGCSGCSRCSHIAFLHDKTGSIGDPLSITGIGEPDIPVIQDIDKAIYAAVTATPQSLEMGSWHTCETTHCRAGWVVTLAGEAGKQLERFHNTELAAMLIYKASGAPINPARFYDGNAAALADMAKRAGVVA